MFSDWRELLSAHDQLPGDQDWRRRECPRAAVLLREDLPPPTEWHQVTDCSTLCTFYLVKSEENPRDFSLTL